jgi:hypothetical protein
MSVSVFRLFSHSLLIILTIMLQITPLLYGAMQLFL